MAQRNLCARAKPVQPKWEPEARSPVERCRPCMPWRGQGASVVQCRHETKLGVGVRKQHNQHTRADAKEGGAWQETSVVQRRSGAPACTSRTTDARRERQMKTTREEAGAKRRRGRRRGKRGGATGQQETGNGEREWGTGRGGEGVRARVGPIRPHATAARQSRGTRTTLGSDRRGVDNTRQD